VRGGAAARFAAEIVGTFDVRTPGTAVAAASLSGGNLQKFIVGREILQKPTVLVVSQPTWGVDAGAAASIHQALADLVAEGSPWWWCLRISTSCWPSPTGWR
jgi:general nucleoside transport system ATP-binding protein